MRQIPLVGLLGLLLSIPLLAAQAPVIGPTDAVGFDYLDADMAITTRFESSYDNGPWASVQIPTTVPLGKTYKVIPPYTSGSHTVLFRACNSAGCGSASVPFAFVYAATSPTVAPGNIRKVPR